MRFCNCTNQCPSCGACCAAGCEHRAWVRTTPTITTTFTGAIPPIGPPALTEERIRQIIREEITVAINETEVVQKRRGAR